MALGSRDIEVRTLVDVHTHLREGEVSPYLVRYALWGGATVLGAMPNVGDGLQTEPQVGEYIATIRKQVAELARETMDFFPPGLSSDQLKIFGYLALTEETSRREIVECKRSEIVNAKVYPLDRTTNSHFGVRRYGRLLEPVRNCGETGITVHFHPEHPNMAIGNRDAEYLFLPIVDMFLAESDAVIVWEHGTDARCIPFWKQFAHEYPGRFFVTLTAHHLLANEDGEYGNNGSVCKPPIKTDRDREDLVRLVGEDYDWVMAGGDSAWHPRLGKLPASGCCRCGAFTAPFLLSLYAHALGHLLCDKDGHQNERGRRIFNRFVSDNARELHGLPESQTWAVLDHTDWTIPDNYRLSGNEALPFWGGKRIDWSIRKTYTESI